MFSIIMVISFLQILQESFEKLLPEGDHTITRLPAVVSRTFHIATHI